MRRPHHHSYPRPPPDTFCPRLVRAMNFRGGNGHWTARDPRTPRHHARRAVRSGAPARLAKPGSHADAQQLVRNSHCSRFATARRLLRHPPANACKHGEPISSWNNRYPLNNLACPNQPVAGHMQSNGERTIEPIQSFAHAPVGYTLSSRLIDLDSLPILPIIQNLWI
jgi:hypothetical protein